VFLFSQFFGQKLLKFYQMDVFEKRSIRILAYFYAQFFSPTGDRFCNKNGLAKNLQKKSGNKGKEVANKPLI
jgi:hypothetical protein